MCVCVDVCVGPEKENPRSGLDSHFLKMGGGGEITLSCLNYCEGLT